MREKKLSSAGGKDSDSARTADAVDQGHGPPSQSMAQFYETLFKACIPVVQSVPQVIADLQAGTGGEVFRRILVALQCVLDAAGTFLTGARDGGVAISLIDVLFRYAQNHTMDAAADEHWLKLVRYLAPAFDFQLEHAAAARHDVRRYIGELIKGVTSKRVVALIGGGRLGDAVPHLSGGAKGFLVDVNVSSATKVAAASRGWDVFEGDGQDFLRSPAWLGAQDPTLNGPLVILDECCYHPEFVIGITEQLFGSLAGTPPPTVYVVQHSRMMHGAGHLQTGTFAVGAGAAVTVSRANGTLGGTEGALDAWTIIMRCDSSVDDGDTTFRSGAVLGTVCGRSPAATLPLRH